MITKLLKPLICIVLLFSIQINYSQNSCETAVTVTAGTHTVTTVDGNGPPLDCTTSTNGSNGEWYIYTAPNNPISVTITTDLAVNSGGDTRFNVYVNDCNNLVCFGGDDDSGVIGNGFLSIYQFNTTPNQSYYIIFDNKWNSGGFDFQINEGAVVLPPEGEITFTTQSVSTLGSPYVIVDMNGDFLDDLVSTSGTEIRINYQKNDGSFDLRTVTTPSADHPASWSIAAGDLDGNGYMDLLYGGGGGATFMLGNVSSTTNALHHYATDYTEISPSKYIFSQRTNFADINNDGLLDAFVCHDVDSNVYFINDGSGGLITHQVGDGNSVDLGILGRNYATIFIDYDNDHDIDMFISKCGGDAEATKNRLYRNNGDGTYTDVSIVSGLNSSIQTWSSAWGDFNNDGLMDVMVGASNGSNELMRNNGDGTFTDITAGSGFDTFNITSHEYIAKDFNNDGLIDVLSSGTIMINNGNFNFTPSESTVGQGCIGDANNDGFLDVFTGGNIKINNNTVGNWLKVNTIGTTSNSNGIGARVEIVSALGTQIRDIRSGVGFKYMSSLTAHFGLDEDTTIQSITVYWPSGNIDIINNPTINSTVNITENSSPLSVNEDLINNTTIFPNPVEKELTINTTMDLENSLITIFNIQGKKIFNSKFNTNNIDVSSLQSGIYFLRIIKDNLEANLKFVKK
jgi:hypothetical protein